ncbi:MAG TPA: hypothetical protein VME17_05285 [Bryobacteraceae bacterium]|nr:hypothetical protein [Bryobacteraceae bacterium]
MWEVVKSLPEYQQKSLKMYYVDNYPAAECADAVGLSLDEFVALKRFVRQRFLDAVALAPASSHASPQEQREREQRFQNRLQQIAERRRTALAIAATAGGR